MEENFEKINEYEEKWRKCSYHAGHESKTLHGPGPDVPFISSELVIFHHANLKHCKNRTKSRKIFLIAAPNLISGNTIFSG